MQRKDYPIEIWVEFWKRDPNNRHMSLDRYIQVCCEQADYLVQHPELIPPPEKLNDTQIKQMMTEIDVDHVKALVMGFLNDNDT